MPAFYDAEQPRGPNPAFARQVVAYPTHERPVTIIVDPGSHFLYLIHDAGQAIRYGVGVGAEGWTAVGLQVLRSNASMRARKRLYVLRCIRDGRFGRSVAGYALPPSCKRSLHKAKWRRPAALAAALSVKAIEAPVHSEAEIEAVMTKLGSQTRRRIDCHAGNFHSDAS